MGRTDYLDGLRGLAALAVMLSHFEPLLVSSITGIYAPSGIIANAFYMITSGSLAVAIFFVLSGYVLLISYDKRGGNALAIGAIKRYFRLSPPIVASMILTYFLLRYVGYHGSAAASLMGGHQWLSLQDQSDLSFVRAVYLGIISPLAGSNPYNGVLWTMNVEFIGGIGLFGIASLFYRSNLYWLCAIFISSISIYLLGVYGIHFSLFLLGSILVKHRQTYYSSNWVLLIPAGLFLGFLRPWHGTMQSFQILFGYSESTAFQVQITLNSIGGALIVVAVISSPICRKILQWRPLTYLGNISFSLYLVHLPIFLSIGCLCFISTKWMGLNAAATVAAVVAISTSFAAAHALTITADRFSTYLSNSIGHYFMHSFKPVDAGPSADPVEIVRQVKATA